MSRRDQLGAPGAHLEKVIGPVFGHFFACYTVRAGDGYHAYAKLCPERPDDVWDTPRALDKVACGPYPDPERALLGVVSRARRKLEQRHEMLWIV